MKVLLKLENVLYERILGFDLNRNNGYLSIRNGYDLKNLDLWPFASAFSAKNDLEINFWTVLFRELSFSYRIVSNRILSLFSLGFCYLAHWVIFLGWVEEGNINQGGEERLENVLYKRIFEFDLNRCPMCTIYHHKNPVSFFSSGLVHRYLCIGNLPPQPAAGLPHAQDRPSHVRAGGWRRRGPGAAHQTVRRVPSIHSETAR